MDEETRLRLQAHKKRYEDAYLDPDSFLGDVALEAMEYIEELERAISLAYRTKDSI